jgi:hypothetical protein
MRRRVARSDSRQLDLAASCRMRRRTAGSAAGSQILTVCTVQIPASDGGGGSPWMGSARSSNGSLAFFVFLFIN